MRSNLNWGNCNEAFAYAALLGALLIGSAARAKDVYLSRENRSCGSWTELRKNHAGWVRTAQIETWALEFISGLNAASNDVPNAIHGLDTSAVFGWLDNYCSSHPLAKLDTAVHARFGNLLVKSE